MFQNKTYARELDHKDLKFRGRIRIQLKNEDGTPKYEKYPTRKLWLWLNCSETSLKLQTCKPFPTIFCIVAMVAHWVKHWPADLVVLGLRPIRGICSIVQEVALQSFIITLPSPCYD